MRTNEFSLADRLAAEHFAIDNGELLIGGQRVSALAKTYGTPFFAYDGAVMRRSYRALAAALEGFAEIHFSVKANPAPDVIALFLAEGAGVEIASVGEYRKARAAGASPESVLFAGPGKGAHELAEVIEGGVGEIHLESGEEIRRVSAIGTRLGRDIPVAIRINPVATAQGGAMRMGGKPSPFGFDEEELETVVATILGAPHLDLVGVHLFAGTQNLDAEVLAAQWAHGIDLAARVAALAGRPLRTIDLGGGLGIPYYAGDEPLDLGRLASAVPRLAAQHQAIPALRDARIIVEPGRFLTGPSGVYVAAVNARKTSRGTDFVVIDGGMHHHLAASGNLGQIVKRDYPVLAPARLADRPRRLTSVVGPLCTPLDTLARQAELPTLQAGDLVAVLQSGAYGATASPCNFLSHPAAAELLVENGVVTVLQQGRSAHTEI